MNKIKKGTIVSRKSYGNDIIFIVEEVVKINKEKYANLKGVTLRIKANSPISDLIIVDKSRLQQEMEKINEQIYSHINENRDFFNKYFNVLTGKILHLDGDRKYAEKSARYYKKMGLNAIVKNIPESKQQFVIGSLIRKYNPDILVITGHDGMIKNGTGFTDIYNYRNSRYFVNTVKAARQERGGKDLIIFAGACQSFFEAIMDSGANFASSPARVLIDFMDPLIIAEKIAITSEEKEITISEISKILKDNYKRIGGKTSMDKKKKYTF